MDTKEKTRRLRNIREVFKKRKWSKTLLMRLSGVSYPTILSALKGNVKTYPATITAVEKALGILEKIG